MKLQRAFFVLVGITLVFSGKSSAQQVKTDYDRSANFAQFRTYSWEQVKTQNALDVDRVKSAVNAALAAKGWTKVESGGDVSIVAMEITRNQQTLNTFYDGLGGAGVGGDLEEVVLERPRPPRKRTRLGLSSSISLMLSPSN
jgi:hypothetical protein